MTDTTKSPQDTHKSAAITLICKNCNTLLETAVHFCPKCGTLMVTSPQGAISTSTPASVPSGNAIKSSKGVSRSLSALRKNSMPLSAIPTDKASMPLNFITQAALTVTKANTPTITEENLVPSSLSTYPSQKSNLDSTKIPDTTNSSSVTPDTKKPIENLNRTEIQPTTAPLDLKTQTQAAQAEAQLKSPTLQFPRKSLQPWGLPPSDVLEVISLSQPNLSPTKSSQPLLYYQFNTTNRRLQMLPAVINTFPHSKKRHLGLGSCLVWALVVILVLLLIGLGVSWFSVIRPSIHAIAEKELNTALDRAEDNIPPPLLFVPGMTVPVHEQTLTEILVGNLGSPSPIENPVTHITPSNARLDFQLYGFPCSITVVPQVTNGHFVVSNVNIEGIISLVMSPDEMTMLLDTHLAHAQEIFQHSVTNVQLKDQEMDLTFAT